MKDTKIEGKEETIKSFTTVYLTIGYKNGPFEVTAV